MPSFAKNAIEAIAAFDDDDEEEYDKVSLPTLQT
jgi:hypothetical protein